MRRLLLLRRNLFYYCSCLEESLPVFIFLALPRLDPRLFAEEVREEMGRRLGLPLYQ